MFHSANITVRDHPVFSFVREHIWSVQHEFNKEFETSSTKQLLFGFAVNVYTHWLTCLRESKDFFFKSKMNNFSLRFHIYFCSPKKKYLTWKQSMFIGEEVSSGEWYQFYFKEQLWNVFLHQEEWHCESNSTGWWWSSFIKRRAYCHTLWVKDGKPGPQKWRLLMTSIFGWGNLSLPPPNPCLPKWKLLIENLDFILFGCSLEPWVTERSAFIL